MQIQKITNRNITFTANESAESTVTIGLIRGKAHNFIIDTGTGGGFAQAILDYLVGDPLPIIVVNTHHHWDHVYGNWMFDGKEIIAHKLCPRLMDAEWETKLTKLKAEGAYLLGEVHKHLPNRLIDAPLHFAKDGVLIFPTPGHSADCISILDEIDKVLYVGDNFGIDEDGLCYWGYSGDFEAEDIDEKYAASFFAMMQSLSIYDYETAVLSHGGHVPRADFATLEEEFKE